MTDMTNMMTENKQRLHINLVTQASMIMSYDNDKYRHCVIKNFIDFTGTTAPMQSYMSYLLFKAMIRLSNM